MKKFLLVFFISIFFFSLVSSVLVESRFIFLRQIFYENGSNTSSNVSGDFLELSGGTLTGRLVLHNSNVGTLSNFNIPNVANAPSSAVSGDVWHFNNRLYMNLGGVNRQILSSEYDLQSGSRTSGFIRYTGVTRNSGFWYGGTTAPISTSIILNYDGILRATQLCMGGSCRNNWNIVTSSAGSNMEVQFNSDNSFGSSSNFVWYDDPEYLIIHSSHDNEQYENYRPVAKFGGNVIAGVIYAEAYEGLSPIAFSNEPDYNYTRFCVRAVDGVVLLETIEFNSVSNKYERVFVPNNDECNKIVFSHVVTDFDYVLMDGEPVVLEILTKFFKNIWTKELSIVIEETINNVSNYEVDKFYNVGDLFKYPVDSVTVYEVLQSHTSQIDWVPSSTPSLYVIKIFHEYNQVTPWVQPQGSHDCYPLGALVTHNGFTWENIVNCNVWEPGVYGWVIV